MKKRCLSKYITAILVIFPLAIFGSVEDSQQRKSHQETAAETASLDLSNILITEKQPKQLSETPTKLLAPTIHAKVDFPFAPLNAASLEKQVGKPALPHHDNVLLAAEESAPAQETSKGILINFNNVSIIEYLRFISRISNRNFLFDEGDLQFNVTIISEEPTSIDNIMTALLQELMIHDLTLIEDGSNFIIHKNPRVNAISTVVSEEFAGRDDIGSDIITQVFRLNTLDPERAAMILRPLVSETALIEPLKDTNHLIVTDLVSNVRKIIELLKSLDAPNSGLVIGQYVSRLSNIDMLIPLVQQIMQPISQDQILTFVPHSVSNSIFIVSSPFLVERSIAILQYLDQQHGSTRIFNLKDLKIGASVPSDLETPSVPSKQPPSHTYPYPPTGIFPPHDNLPPINVPPTRYPPPQEGGLPSEVSPITHLPPRESYPIGPEGEGSILRTPTGQWEPGDEGNWIFRLTTPEATTRPPIGNWRRDYEGNWNFIPGEVTLSGGPRGRWTQDKNGNWIYSISEPFMPGPLVRQYQGGPRLPGGMEKVAQFYIYKLQYRRGDSIEPALRQIADTLQQNERGNEELISALRSVQWLAVPNSLIFSGTPSALEKVQALTREMDAPLRQVFIEMLILETTLDDSLKYGVSYGTRFAGGDVAGGQSFYSGSTPILGALASAGISGLGEAVGTATALIPNPTGFTQTSGFNLGIIGRKLTHNGTEFASIAALVNAVHDRTKDEVVSNPKILVEDNSPAEIFVGLNTPYRTQSISNDRGTVLTSNFEYRDIGTRLKVTPFLGNGDIIALDIEEEISTIVAGLIINADTASTSPGPTTRINRTATRVHIPDEYFLVISGMMQDEESRERNQVPCLGGVPLLGAFFSSKDNRSQKRNLMIFIRPKIIDTEEEVQWITKHQQDIYDYKNCLKNSDEYEVVEALDFFNVKKTLHPEDVYDCECE